MTTRLAPDPVRTPVTYQTWSTFTAISWPYDAAVVQALLPPGLEVQTAEGTAWVSITPFLMTDVRPPGLPAVPRLSTFPETNVRTYVVDRTGQDGIWFFSLEAACLGLVLAARGAYRVPYCWAAMAIDRRGPTIHYRSRRRWPGPQAARSEITVEPGDPITPEDLTDLDVFLTHRWRGYTLLPVGLGYVPVAHEPWPLWRATLRGVDETLLGTAGLPRPAADPLLHYSPGVHARLGLPKLVP